MYGIIYTVKKTTPHKERNSLFIIFNYKRTNNSLETISTIIYNMADEDFYNLADLDSKILLSLSRERKNALAKAQRICKKYGITYGDYVAWAVTD